MIYNDLKPFMKANDEERQKLICALEKGNFEYSDHGQEYWDRAGVIKIGKDADWTIVKVESRFWGGRKAYDEKGEYCNQGGMEICWQTVSAGFGSLTVYIDQDGKLKADTEGMSKEFCKAVFAKLIDNWEE